VLNTDGRGSELRGRRSESKTLDRLLADARKDHSGVVVVRGEAGVGKTALLDYLAERAHGFRIVRAVGIESEMELAYAGLHQLCAPLLDGLEGLPAPQRDALSTAFGISAGEPPDRFLVGLAVLSLVSEVAEGQPLLWIVDARFGDQRTGGSAGTGSDRGGDARQSAGLAGAATRALADGIGVRV